MFHQNLCLFNQQLLFCDERNNYCKVFTCQWAIWCMDSKFKVTLRLDMNFDHFVLFCLLFHSFLMKNGIEFTIFCQFCLKMATGSEAIVTGSEAISTGREMKWSKPEVKWSSILLPEPIHTFLTLTSLPKKINCQSAWNFNSLSVIRTF